MILVRDIFQLKFGKAKEARELWKEAQGIMGSNGHGPSRAMTDLTGPYYTLVLEGTYPNLATFEKTMSESFGDPAWQRWYQKFTTLVDSGRREMFTVLE